MDEALGIDVGDYNGTQLALYQAGRIAAARGDTQAAVSWLEQSLAMAVRLGAVTNQAEVRAELVRIGRESRTAADP